MNGNLSRFARLIPHPSIIPAIRRHQDIARAVSAPAPVVFHLAGDLGTLTDEVEQIHAAGKRVFVHLDLVTGLSQDGSAIKYLARIGCDGVVSTRSHVIREANDRDIHTLFRIFALDSGALDTGIRKAKQCSPDAVEVLPGILPPRLLRLLRRELEQPLVVGGLIETDEEVLTCLKSGIWAISTSKQELWRREDLLKAAENSR